MIANYYNVSVINPLGFLMLSFCCITLLTVDRKHAFWPIIIMVLFVSMAQRIVIFGLDFNQMRIMALVGLMRVLMKGELQSLKSHKLDFFMIAFVLSRVAALLIREGGEAIVYSLGISVDLLVPYYVFRCLVQNNDELVNAIKILSILSSICAVFFINEHFTARNIFSIFGGVLDYTWVRDGRLRCQGAFAHPIIAGVYFATILPLFVALFWTKLKSFAIAGMVAASIVIVASSSSTPVFGALAAMLAALVFLFREHMKVVRWSVYSLIGFLHVMMNAPVWALISRVSATGGSTSYYRFMLIDVTIHHFSDWYLVGSANYIEWVSYGLTDLTNGYVSTAISGGVLSLFLFVSIIAIAFGSVGRMWRYARKDKAQMVMAWALGCSLFGLSMSYIGVALWGQMLMLWPMVLAMIVSIDRQNQYEKAITGKEIGVSQVPANY